VYKSRTRGTVGGRVKNGLVGVIGRHSGGGSKGPVDGRFSRGRAREVIGRRRTVHVYKTCIVRTGK